MKKFYRTTFFISSILLILLSLVAYCGWTKDTIYIHRLAKNPDQWELKLSESAHDIFPEGTERYKKSIIQLTEDYRKASLASSAWLATGFFVTVTFCLIGWRRESHVEKNYSKRTK